MCHFWWDDVIWEEHVLVERKFGVKVEVGYINSSESSIGS